jgi:hypothetical protein
MAQLGRAATNDDVLVWEHGRRLGIVGDAQSGDPSALILDGQVVASNRMTVPFIAKAVLGHNGAGAVTLAGTVIGDTVVSATNLTTPGDVTASFEATISVAGQIQQTAVTNLSAAQVLFVVFPRS